MGVSCLAPVELTRHEVWKVFVSSYESADLGLMEGRCSSHWTPAPETLGEVSIRSCNSYAY
jgi:hypothetical protein